MTSQTTITASTRTAFYLLRFNVALQIAMFAISINLFLAIMTFLYGWNSLYCAFGIDSVIGVLTALILVWRFASSKHDKILLINSNTIDTIESPLLNSNEILKSNDNNNNQSNVDNIDIEKSLRLQEFDDDDIIENDNHLHPFLRSIHSNIENTVEDNHRELWSTFWLGQIMIISGFGVVIRSIIELIHHIIEDVHQQKPKNSKIDFDFEFDGLEFFTKNDDPMHPLYVLALISLTLNVILMALKLFIYYHLSSNSMLIEGVNSFISAVFATMTIISIQFHDCIKYLDQIVSIIFGIFLISYGIYNVLHTLAHTVVHLIKIKRAARRNKKAKNNENCHKSMKYLNQINYLTNKTKDRSEYLSILP